MYRKGQGDDDDDDVASYHIRSFSSQGACKVFAQIKYPYKNS